MHQKGIDNANLNRERARPVLGERGEAGAGHHHLSRPIKALPAPIVEAADGIDIAFGRVDHLRSPNRRAQSGPGVGFVIQIHQSKTGRPSTSGSSRSSMIQKADFVRARAMQAARSTGSVSSTSSGT